MPEILPESQFSIGAIESALRSGRFWALRVDGVRAVDSPHEVERRDRITERLPGIVLVLPNFAQCTAPGVNLALIFVCRACRTLRRGIGCEFPRSTMGAETGVAARTAIP